MKIALTIIILFTCFITFSQLKTGKVLELDDKKGFANTTIYPAGKRGFFLLTKEIEGKKAELSYYSTDLKKQITIPLERKFPTVDLGVVTDEDSVVFSFVESSFYYWVIKEFNTETLTLEQKKYEKTHRYFVPAGSLFFEHKIVINGALHKRAKVMVLDPRTGKDEFLELPGSHPKGAFATVTIDHTYHRLSVLYRTTSFSKVASLNLVFLDADWKLSEPYVLKGDREYPILDGKVIWTGENSFVLAGTVMTNPRGGYKVSGFYFSKWENHTRLFVDYYFFNEFRDYTRYLQGSRQTVTRSISKESPVMEYLENYVVFHPIYVNGSGYRLIGEVYNPKFDYGTTTIDSRSWLDWAFWLVADVPLSPNRRITEYTTTFKGFQFSHAAVLDLDESGNKINDYCFALKPASLSQTLKPLLCVGSGPDGSLKMGYVQQKKGISVQETVADSVKTTFVNCLAKNITDMVGRVQDMRCVSWYENNYLVYGYESLQSKEDFIKGFIGTPSIFFVKRVSYP